MFLGTGRHAREDLPMLLDAARERHPHAAISVTEAVGEWTGLLDSIADEALKRA